MCEPQATFFIRFDQFQNNQNQPIQYLFTKINYLIKTQLPRHQQLIFKHYKNCLNICLNRILQYLSINTAKYMQAKQKKAIAEIQSLIKIQQFQKAYDQADIFVMMNPKLFQGYLLLGLCHQKLKRDKQAEKCYLQVLDLNEGNLHALKQLCDIYVRNNDIANSTKYLEMTAELLKTKDQIKYREMMMKLMKVYTKDENLQKIIDVFNHYVNTQNVIGEDFVEVAAAYFKVSSDCKSFNLQIFQAMGVVQQQIRHISPPAKEKMNILLIDISNYLVSVSKQFSLTDKVIADSLCQMKNYFPDASCMLMLLLLNEYAIGQVDYSYIILPQIYLLLQAFYDKAENQYTNLQDMDPQIFGVCMLLGFQYLAFFQQFFNLDQIFSPYMQRLNAQKQQLEKLKIREEYRNKISRFLLRQCRIANQISQTTNIQKKLQQLKKRIKVLENSFLEEVLAKMAMNCFVDYYRLEDMKNLIKVRINNSNKQTSQVHLYKYLYDYLIKIAKMFRILDEQINIYDAIDLIVKEDPDDTRYVLEKQWVYFSKYISQKNQQLIQNIESSILIMENKLPLITSNSIKSQYTRKLLLMKIYLKRYQNMEEQLMKLLLIEKSFENLQLAGSYYFKQTNYQKSLVYLKQAFVLNQKSFHLNRLIFLCFKQLNKINEGQDFLQRIYQGFNTIFWINYILYVKRINEHSYQQAQNYLNQAIQNFNNGEKKYKTSYEKTIQFGDYAFMYMISQNNINIIYDELLITEEQIGSIFTMTTFDYCTISPKKLKLRLWSQMGQVLKLIGRTKSSYNFLTEAYNLIAQIPAQQKEDQNYLLQQCLLKKQYATILFYMLYYRQSQIVLFEANNEIIALIEKHPQNNFYKQIQSEIKAIFFEIALEKLLIMIKFDSRQTISTYIDSFTLVQPSKPSLNYLKSEYQFFILSHLHTKKNIQNCFTTIDKFLAYFQIKATQISSQNFQNTIFQLDSEKRRLIRQCLQDLMVLKYIGGAQKIQIQDIMSLIQLFPQSSIFYIVYGMAVTDNKLKLAAFLKCIQIDKQSPISIELLASLYLKGKNYISACKLFLKSLQMDMTNPVSYFGITVSLMAIMTRFLSSKQANQKQLFERCFCKIASYMQYLRCVDPSQNYQILNFYRLLLSDRKQNLFNVKLILEDCRKVSTKDKKQYILIQILEDCTKQIFQNNMWKQEQILVMKQNYIRSTANKLEIANDKEKISRQLVKIAKRDIQKLLEGNLAQELKLKKVAHFMNDINISLNLALQTKQFNKQYFQEILQTLKLVSLDQNRSQQIILMATNCKQNMYEYILYDFQQTNRILIEQTFLEIKVFDYIVQLLQKSQSYSRLLSKLIWKNPSNQFLKKVLATKLVIKNGRKVLKNKHLNHFTTIINDTYYNNDEKEQRAFKKLMVLYRTESAWIGYIENQWKQTRMRTHRNILKWIQIVNYFYSKTTVPKEKLCQIRIQLLAYGIRILDLQVPQLIFYTKQQQENYNCLCQIFTFANKPSIQCLNKIKSANLKSNHLQALFSSLINKYQGINMQKLLERSYNLTQCKISRGVICLIRFINTLQYQVQQTVKLQKLQRIIAISESQTSIELNSISIMKCITYLLRKQYQAIQQQIVGACQRNQTLSHSDQLGLNFFEVIMNYNQIVNNKQQIEATQNFQYFINAMILLSKDNYQKGFYLFLRGIVQSMYVPQGQNKMVKELRLAKLLCPGGWKMQ